MEETDLAAIGRVISGDADAFGLLVERHSRSVFRLAYRITCNESDAEEVVQEAFLRAFREIRRYESRASFSTWVGTIAANCALDVVRKRKRFVSTDEEEGAAPVAVCEAPGPDREANSRRIGELIDKTMGQLSLQERTAFTLRHYEGMPIETISKELGLSENATKQSIFRAVQKLRRVLGPWVGVVVVTLWIM
ncbi:MAG TPA: RNA polymerase sigma factor [Bryobacteraceae bacterium]|nr:RNA polymerase sigma factor [Bryobacteraceae bacterium]